MSISNYPSIKFISLLQLKLESISSYSYFISTHIGHSKGSYTTLFLTCCAGCCLHPSRHVTRLYTQRITILPCIPGVTVPRACRCLVREISPLLTIPTTIDHILVLESLAMKRYFGARKMQGHCLVWKSHWLEEYNHKIPESYP